MTTMSLLMNYSLQMLGISAFIIFGYCYLIVKPKYGITKSISDSVYHVKPYWLFALTMIIFPIFFGIAAINVSTTVFSKIMASCAMILITMVGFFNCYQKEKIELKLHVIGATGGIFFGLIYLVSLNKWYILPVVIYITFVIYALIASKYAEYKNYSDYYKKKWFNRIERWFTNFPAVPSHTWYIEIFAIILIMTIVLIEILKA